MATRSEILKAIRVIAEVASDREPQAEQYALDAIDMLCTDGLSQEDEPSEEGPTDEPQPAYAPELPAPWYRSQDGNCYFHPTTGMQVVWEPDMARWQVEFPGDRMRRGRFDDPTIAAGWAEVEYVRMQKA